MYIYIYIYMSRKSQHFTLCSNGSCCQWHHPQVWCPPVPASPQFASFGSHPKTDNLKPYFLGWEIKISSFIVNYGCLINLWIVFFFYVSNYAIWSLFVSLFWCNFFNCCVNLSLDFYAWDISHFPCIIRDVNDHLIYLKIGKT